MIFSKLGRDSLPLWWLIFLKEKVVTRRPPPCKSCGKKWGEHAFNHSEFLDGTCNGQDVNTLSPRRYEPDLSRWQPKGAGIKMTVSGGSEGGGMAGFLNATEYRLDGVYKYKEIAIQPARTKAAICANCGGWKEHHYPYLNAQTYEKDQKAGRCQLITVNGDTMTFLYGNLGKVKIEICSSYAPLRKKIKSVQMENDWLAKVGIFDYGSCKDATEAILWDLQEEAKREGFATWLELREVLKMYPSGTPLARIEFG